MSEKNDMLERMKKLLEEGSVWNPPNKDFYYLMNTDDYMRYKRTMPKLRDDVAFQVDDGIRPSPYIEKGTAYKIKKSFFSPELRTPIRSDALEKEIENAFAGYMYGYGTRRGWYNPQPKTEAELRAMNSNWSQVWDEWRYRDDYKQFWIYRTVVKIKQWILRRK